MELRRNFDFGVPLFVGGMMIAAFGIRHLGA